jgi:hypothetical protein
MELYLDEKPVFEKIAAEVDLPEDAAQWPQEIMQELYKQVPYVADFHPDVNMETVNAEQGYGFGHFEVQNKSEAPTGSTPEQESNIGIRHVRIPVIVKDFKLQPFDVLITEDSKMLPLTESRLRQALFRPQAFDVTSRTPGDQSMIGQLYPPYRQNYGFGGGGMGVSADMGKTSSAKTAEEEKAALSGSTMASYLKKQTNPQGLASASKSLIGRGTQKVLEGGDVAKRGRQLVNAGNVAAQKIVQSSALEQYLAKESDDAKNKDLADRIEKALGSKKALGDIPSKPVQTLGVDREAAKKEAGVTANDPEGEKWKGRLGRAGGAVGAGTGLLGGVAAFQHMNHPLAQAGTILGSTLLGAGGGYGMGRMIGADTDKALAKKEGAASYPVSDAALSQKIKDVVPKVKLGSLLGAISDTVYEGDYDRMATSISSYAGAYAANGAFTGPALTMLAGFVPSTLEKRAERWQGAFKSDVIQLVRGQEGYVMKSASSQAWLPVTRDLDRGEAIKIFGEKIVLAADATGAATMEAGPNVSEEGESPADVKPGVIDSFGLYKVQAVDGRDLVGFVIPNLIDVDGSSLPICLFTNGSEHALQGEIVGEPAGAGTNLPTGSPQGHGMFFRARPNGVVEATVPLDIMGGVGTGEYAGQTFDGRQVKVVLQPNVKRAIALEEGTLVLPEDFSWCPMGEAKQVELVADPGQFHKQAEAGRKLASVTVRAGGENSFSFDGLPLRKLGSDERTFLTYDDAIFLLAGLGADTKYGATKLAESLAFSAPVEVRIGRHITPLAESVEASRKTAEATLSLIPRLKVDLAKEAAFLPDPTAVDTVLSLGFINPENIRTFVSYLPQIEDVESKLCELLISSRLGIKDLPIGALEKTVKTLEDVVEGLKTMAFVGKE